MTRLSAISRGLAALALVVALAPTAAEARTRTFCDTIFGGGHTRACGGHLQPACDSGPACDAGYASYSGDPFPIKIDCPSPISDETVSSGCYDRDDILACGACGGAGQVPCPQAASNFCAVGCEPGLLSNPTTTLCEVPGTPGTACGPGYGCGPGLSCDLTRFQCVREAEAGESCANPFVGCADGLACTGALECSHEPARLGETCDVFNPCGEGLFCQAGLPQRCEKRARLGEACGPGKPCMQGTACEPCLTGDCNAILQCVLDHSGTGPISTQQCKNLYSPRNASQAAARGLARTIGFGAGITRGEGRSFEVGVAYGPDGEYGCYYSACEGGDLDISIEAYDAVGSFLEFDGVGGESWFWVVEGALPGQFVNISQSAIYDADPFSPGANLIGEAKAAGIGIGPNPIPISAGFYQCSTTLDSIDGEITPGDPGVPPPNPGPVLAAAPEAPPAGFGALDFDGDDALAVTDAAALSALRRTGPLTLSAWMRPALGDATREGARMVLNKEGEYELGLWSGELGFAIAYPGGWTFNATGVHPPLGAWSHVAVVYDGAAVWVYVDGEPVHQQEAAGAVGDVHPGEEELRIGGRQRGGNPFLGSVDGVRVYSRALSRAEVRDLLEGEAAGGPSGLVAAWDFEEQSGLLRGSGPAGVALALDGLGATRAPSRVDGARSRRGGALFFDGKDDHAAVTDPAALARLVAVDALSLEAWVHPLGPGGGAEGGTILSKEGEYWLGRGADGRLRFALATASPGWQSPVQTGVLLPEGEWSHVALVYADGLGEAVVYRNGEAVATFPVTGPLGDALPDLDQLRMGGRQLDDESAGPREAFHGVLDEVRVWLRARSAEEIAANWERPVFVNHQGGLAGEWRFDGAGSAVLFEASGASLHGALGAGRSWQFPRRTDPEAFFGYSPLLVAPKAQRLPACGLGPEAALGLAGLVWVRRRRVRSAAGPDPQPC